MWKILFLIISIFGCNANTHSTAKPLTLKFSPHSVNFSAICDNPPPTIEPEMCCDFTNFFNESIVEKCELDFALAEKSAANLITDSCIIECIFNKSGLAIGSKIDKVKILRLIEDKSKNVNEWKNITSKAVNTCLDELTDDELAEISQNLKQDLADQKSMKMCNPSASVILDCIYRELFKVCPNNKLTTTSTDCLQLKEYAFNCDDW